MKKILAVLLSAIMVVSTFAFAEFSVSAEEPETTTLTIGSDVYGAEDDDIFIYKITVNNVPVSDIAYGLVEEEYEINSGFVEIPSYDYITLDIPYDATYSVLRYETPKEGYFALPEEKISGVANKYNYYENYIAAGTPYFNDLTMEEYLSKTNNETSTSRVYYYDAVTGNEYAPSDLTTGTYYSESLTEENRFDIGFIPGSEINYQASLDITAKYNVGSFMGTYFYSGTITLKVGETVYEQEYVTVPSATLSTAKQRAIDSIIPIVRGYAAQAINDVVKEKTSSAYFADSLEAMLPKASDLTTKAEDVKIVSRRTRIVECEPIEKVTVSYGKELNELGEEAIFESEFVKLHTHNFTEVQEIVPPTCLDDGYTVYKCTECSLTEERDIISADPDNHRYSESASNNDGVLPTCTTEGKTTTRSSKCIDCGKEEITGGTVIQAYGHKLSEPVVENKVDATCTENGSYEEVIYCTRLNCGEEVSRTKKTINKLGHKYDNGVVKTKANCGVAGTMLYTCKVCGKTKTESIKPTGNHNYKSKVTKAPTSSKAGVMTHTCKNCNNKYTSTIKKLDKASISGLTAKSKGFTVKWKKVSSATGYQIQFATNKKFNSPRTVTVTKNSTVTKTITNKKAKTKYFVRIRTYRTINGTKYYSAWSSSKTVTTKK